MSSLDESDLKGIKIQSTEKGFLIILDGPLYKRVNENLNNGKFTKEFYHELKGFIQKIKSFE